MHTKRAPRRTPPPPPSSREQAQNASPSSQGTTKTIGGGAPPLGAFWSTQYAKDPHVSEDNGPLFFYEGPGGETTFKTSQQHPENRGHMDSTCPPKGQNVHVGHQNKMSLHGSSQKRYDASSEDFEIRFFSEDKDHDSEKNKASKVENVGIYKNEAFKALVAEFDSTKLNSGNNRTGKEALEAEVERLKEQLKQASLEKGEITSKYEKLSAICHSQRQEIQELKQALTARIPSPNTDGSRVQQSSPSGREHNTQVLFLPLHIHFSSYCLMSIDWSDNPRQWLLCCVKQKSIPTGLKTFGNGQTHDVSSPLWNCLSEVGTAERTQCCFL